MTPADFQVVQSLVRQRSAIVLEPGKEYLAEARLTPLAKREGMGLSDLVGRLRNQPYGDLHRRSVEAMTTNETSFFRDLNPFEAIRKRILPEVIAERRASRTLTLWCAASSTGQEPYSVAMLIKEHFPELAGWTIQFIASDLSLEVLDRARKGVFSQLEVNRGLSAQLLVKCFTRHGSEWIIREDLRKMIEFRHVNLIESWPTMPQLDLIFMRNVLIYFDVETKKTILRRARQLMRPSSYLLLGGAETTLMLDDHLETVHMDKFACCRLRQVKQ